jgi:hypothetical protein
MNLLEQVAIIGDAVRDTEAPPQTLTLRTSANAINAGAALSFSKGEQNWSWAQSLVFNLRANGAHRLRLRVTHGKGTWTLFLIPRPGLNVRVVIPFAALIERQRNSSHPGYSRFGGGPEPVDLSAVQGLEITFNQVSPEDKEIILSGMALHADVPEPMVLDPQVVVDAWGQWLGERGAPRSEEEIRAVWASEPATFTGFPGHTDLTGADAKRGPVAEGTGFFRVAEVEGRWLLVDPAGFPFFSTGVDCVRPFSEGPVGGGREALFADLSHAEEREGRPGRVTPTLWQISTISACSAAMKGSRGRIDGPPRPPLVCAPGASIRLPTGATTT